MTRKIALLGLVPALALGLSACGSSNTDAGSNPSASSTSSSMSSMPMTSTSSSSSSSPSSSSSAEAATANISISNFMFKVPTTVPAGAMITVKNNDSQAHTVTSKAGGFDVKVDPNGTAMFKAPSKPGKYAVICIYHSNMSSTLVVK